MTIDFATDGNYQGFVRAGGVHFINCTIKGMGSNWGIGDVVFDNCSFINTDTGGDYEYNLWTYSGKSFTFNDCTFTNKNGRFINVYTQGTNVVDVTLNSCKFINKKSAAKKAAVLIKGETVWNVVINNCVLEGSFTGIDDANTCSHDSNGLWLIEDPASGNKITVNGAQVYPTV